MLEAAVPPAIKGWNGKLFHWSMEILMSSLPLYLVDIQKKYYKGQMKKSRDLQIVSVFVASQLSANAFYPSPPKWNTQNIEEGGGVFPFFALFLEKVRNCKRLSLFLTFCRDPCNKAGSWPSSRPGIKCKAWGPDVTRPGLLLGPQATCMKKGRQEEV